MYLDWRRLWGLAVHTDKVIVVHQLLQACREDLPLRHQPQLLLQLLTMKTGLLL